MKNIAAFLTKPQTIEFSEVPMPIVGDGDILLKLEAVGVCGSDLHYYEKGRIGDFVVEYPFILGHECAGTIVETGGNVKGLKAGDRVALEPGVPCGHCGLCKKGKYNLCKDVRFFATPPYHGCLMNYVAFPAEFAFMLPDSVSSVEGALIEPLAIGVNAALTGGVKLGDTVVILGAGCIGLVSMLAAKAYGAAKVIVTDILKNRLEAARKMGALTVNSKSPDAENELIALCGGAADVVIDCAGISSTVATALKIAAPAANVVIVGLGADKVDGFDISAMSVKELNVTSIFRYRNLYPTAISAVETGKIDIKNIVSDVFAFEDTPAAFAKSLAEAGRIVKSVIQF